MSQTSPPRRSKGREASGRAETFLPSGRYGSPMRVYVVDNGGQWTHREWRVLKYLGVETKIGAKDTRASEPDGLDGLVLSGGAPPPRRGPRKRGRDGADPGALAAPLL